MTRFDRPQSPFIYFAIIASVITVFVIDVLTPLGVGVWVFYLIPMTLSLYVRNPTFPLLVAATVTATTAAGFVLSPPSDVLNPSKVNRSLLCIAVWSMAIVARRFILTRRRLAEQDWVRSGQRDLGLVMQGEQQPHELGDNILRFLCHYLDAPVATFYVCEPDGSLHRVAAHASGAPIGAEKAVLSRGEGQLGQAVEDKQLRRLQDIPPGYLQISSTLGQVAPTEIVLLPLQADSVVSGAVELGFLRTLGQVDLNLLTAVAEPIAVAIRSLLFRTRLEELLEETQRQAEALQTQQEELRVTNEELESQSQLLRDSQTNLEAQQAELEQINAQLEEQTQDLELHRDRLLKAQAELIQRSEELERANRYKSEFLANMSHELRTPLNSALILAKLLADNKDGNLTPEQVKYAKTIHTSGKDLLDLINDILDLSRIEAGRVDVAPEPVPINRISTTLERTFQPVAMEKNLDFHVTTLPGVPETLITDPLRVQQILRNLLANAFKFTASGSVSLRIHPSKAGGEEQVHFAVHDTGTGIPADKLEIIFEAFRQADGSTQRTYGGTGLGLTISRQLAHRLGGEVTVHSEVGRGSTFTLVLPAQPAQAARETPVAPPPVPIPPSSSPTPSAPAVRSPAAPRKRDSAAVADDRDSIQLGDKTVLIVEDDPTFAGILCEVAHSHHFRCLIATTAAEGLELAKTFVPDAVLLDIHLPDETGLVVLEQLKRSPATRHIPIHVVSGSDTMQQALELGAIGYAVKPVEREQLIATFQKLQEKLEQRLRTVLIVEDTEVQRESLVALLAAENVEIIPLATAGEALDLLKERTVDCMVLDLQLPDYSGYELLDKMAAEESFSFPPVIVYTGRSLSRDEEQRLRRYASSIIIKGARSPERLLDEVTLFLHQVEADLPQEQQRILREVRNRELALEGRTILIAEDDVRNVFALSSVLEPRGAKLRIARNGREALDILDAAHDAASAERSTTIDLVLMDIMMPEMDGLTAMRKIRERPAWKKLPIIALTAKTMPDDRDNCLRAGANDYISKPLDVDKLVSLIKVWMPK